MYVRTYIAAIETYVRVLFCCCVCAQCTQGCGVEVNEYITYY